jgi:hypothetical protein
MAAMVIPARRGAIPLSCIGGGYAAEVWLVSFIGGVRAKIFPGQGASAARQRGARAATH